MGVARQQLLVTGDHILEAEDFLTEEFQAALGLLLQEDLLQLEVGLETFLNRKISLGERNSVSHEHTDWYGVSKSAARGGYDSIY